MSKLLIILAVFSTVSNIFMYSFLMRFLKRNNGKIVAAFIALLITTLLFHSLNGNSKSDRFSIINTYPHDEKAFTQGLIFHDGYIYEGTGLHGRSSIRKVDVKTGKVLKQTNIPDKYFGEGITIFNSKIYQITWKSKTGFIYDTKSFEQTGSFTYPTQGWGITHNNRNLIISDGSSNLYFLDPDSFKIKRILIAKTGEGVKIKNLNELEYVDGKVYANIWQTNKIAIINEETGLLEDLIDLSKLKDQIKSDKKIDVLNGIAYNPENGHFYFTGKLWPKMFEVKLN